MSDFHSITPYGSKVCHGSVTGVTCDTTVAGCDSIILCLAKSDMCIAAEIIHESNEVPIPLD